MHPFRELLNLALIAQPFDLSSKVELRNLRDLYFGCLLVCTGLVGIGLLMEAAEIWYDVRETIGHKSREHTYWLTPSIDRKEYKTPDFVKLLSAVGCVLIVLGVIGEGVFEGFVSKYDGALATLNDTVIAQTQKETAQLLKNAEELKAENLKLEAILQPRRLSSQQKELLHRAFAEFTTNRIFVGCVNGGAEANDFAQDFLEAFNGPGHLNCSQIVAPGFSPPSVQVEAGADRQHDADTLVKALVRIGIDKATIVRRTNAQHDLLALTIGPKPLR